MRRRRSVPILALLVGLALSGSSCGPRGGLGRMEPYADEAHGFALYKPKDWQVGTQQFPNGYQVTVTSPANDSFATLCFLSTRDRRNDSVSFAAQTLRNVRAQTPSLKVNWCRTTQDRRRTVIEAEYRNERQVAMRGRYYFMLNGPDARFFACEAPARRFARSLPSLLSVVANFSFLNPTVSGAGGSAGRATRTPVPGVNTLVRRSLSDGSASLLAPSGWTVLGQKGMCLCSAPVAGAGFAFSTGDFLAPSRIPYFNSAAIRGVRHSPYLAPANAMASLMQELGNRDIRIVARAPNPPKAQEARQRLNRGADAELAAMTFTSAKGVAAKGFFDVLGLQPLPSGQWGILYFAVWAPEDQFDEYRPLLEQMAAGYRINEQWAADYIQRGLANLRRMMGETSRRMADTAAAVRDSSTAAFQERMRSGDYIDYKRTSMIRGEQEWVSEVEGGTLYKSDHWGLSREGERVVEGQPFNYYNFTGNNPRYNESMTPVDASRDVYERVYGQGP